MLFGRLQGERQIGGYAPLFSRKGREGEGREEGTTQLPVRRGRCRTAQTRAIHWVFGHQLDVEGLEAGTVTPSGWPAFPP